MSYPSYHLRTFYYSLDPELKMIHAFKNCASLKVAVKYNYAQEIKVTTEDDAERLDRLVEQGYKTCGACFGREQSLARKDNRRPRPGFLHPPAGYRPPPARPKPKRRRGVQDRD